MKITKIESVRPYLRNSSFVGFGFYAFCYRTPDNKLVKVFIKTDGTTELYTPRKELIDHLELISSISNDSFIGPEEVLVKNDKVIGYIYPYIEGNTMRRIPLDTHLSSLFNGLDKLVEDTYKFSESCFSLKDLHSGNVLFDGERYYIIDMDKGHLNTNAEGIVFPSVQGNLLNLKDAILNSIFKIDYVHFVKFPNNTRLEDMYYNSCIAKKEKMDELYEALCNECRCDDPTVGLIRRRIKTYGKINDYKLKNG